jgi:hypothetical protein
VGDDALTSKKCGGGDRLVFSLGLLDPTACGLFCTSSYCGGLAAAAGGYTRKTPRFWDILLLLQIARRSYVCIVLISLSLQTQDLHP